MRVRDSRHIRKVCGNRPDFPFTAALCVALLVLGSALPVSGAKVKKAGGEAIETASIRGRVADETGGVIPGVEVTLKHRSASEGSRALTDEFGGFEFKGLQPGPYLLTAELSGFQSYRRKIELSPGKTMLLSVVLQLGSVSETVTVSASPGRAQTASARVGKRLSGKRSRNLPLKSREVFQLPPSAAGEPLSQRSGEDLEGNTEAYDYIRENEFIRVAEDPRSTFSIDVDTASYSNLRRYLVRQGQLPPPDAVRIEELINYFPYDHPPPAGEFPFQVTVETASAPWKPGHRLVSIGIKGREIDFSSRPPGNFVFLVDVSGSMGSPDKLPLLKHGLEFLVQQLGADDSIALVVYAGASGLVLDSTPGSQKAEMMAALSNLRAGGSTNGGEGIQLAYQIAQQNFIDGGINRVILATDGDFNVGITSNGELVRLIQKEARAGVFLTVLGFGTGNLKDSTMEKLADRGNGNYAYVDSLQEARKVLVEEIDANLITIAKDVKIQVEFNPREVEAYRLLGYENRLLAHRDFNDDRKDAGEIGAGHSLTVLYEVAPAGLQTAAATSDPLRYLQPTNLTPDAFSGEVLLLRLRYKDPGSSRSRLIEAPVIDDGRPFSAATEDLRFAAAVASFGMLLRGSEHSGEATFADVLEWARQSLGADRGMYRQEFLELVQIAGQLSKPAGGG